MESQPKHISERDLAERIIYLHDVEGLGFRKIARKLTPEGIKMSKDKAHRLYGKYVAAEINTDSEVTDEELNHLDQTEKEVTRSVKLARVKNEKRRRIAGLIVQEAEASLELRIKLFQDKAALLGFAEKVLPVVSPTIWLQLRDYCAMENISIADSLHHAIGSQAAYEEARMDYKREERDYLLDEHLCIRLWDVLMPNQEDESQEESEVAVAPESINKEAEFVTVTIPREEDTWVDLWIPVDEPRKEPHLEFYV